MLYVFPFSIVIITNGAENVHRQSKFDFLIKL